MIDAAKRFISIVLLCAMFFCFVAIVFSLVSCQSPPEILKDKDGKVIESTSCYEARVCSFYHKDKPEVCIDQWKECRARAKYEDCGKDDYRWKGSDCQSCWDKLNSK